MPTLVLCALLSVLLCSCNLSEQEVSDTQPRRPDASKDVPDTPDTTPDLQDTSDATDEGASCEQDSRWVDGRCVACALGFEFASESGSECVEVLCARNEYVSERACAPCPDGESNDAGDRAASGDTTCDGEDPCLPLFGVRCDQVQQQVVKASNAEPDDMFGHAFALSGDTLVVGAPGEDSASTTINGPHGDNDAPSRGAAYVFVRREGSWVQQAYIKPSQAPEAITSFGRSVAVDGDTLAIKANQAKPYENGPTFQHSMVYLFTRDGDQWSEHSRIEDPAFTPFSSFGSKLILQGDTLVIANSSESSSIKRPDGTNTNGHFSGGVYLYKREDGVWSQAALLKASNSSEYANFGASISLNDTLLAIGSPGEKSNATGVGGDQDNTDARSSGAVYVFEQRDDTWVQQAYIKASNTNTNDRFGSAVSLHDQTLVVGAPGEGSNVTGVGRDQFNNDSGRSGAVYVFTQTGDLWTQQAYIKASNTGSTDEFGHDVWAHENLILVSARQEDSVATGIHPTHAGADQPDANLGAVYLFARDQGIWSQRLYIKSPFPLEQSNQFGSPLFLSKDGLAIGMTNALHTLQINTP